MPLLTLARNSMAVAAPPSVRGVFACSRLSLLAWSGGALLMLRSVLPGVAPPRAVESQGLPGQLRQRAVRQLGAGKLLVAARNLRDPHFAKTVVLLIEFTPQAAMGLILNRPTDVPLTEMLPDLKGGSGRAMTIFFGGPVPERGALALLRSATTRRDARPVVKDVYLVNTREMFEGLVASGAGPDRFRVYVGYAGWGEGQLERETALGSWHVVDGAGDVVFDPDSGSLWQRQMLRIESRLASNHRPEPDAPGRSVRPIGH